MSRDIHNFCHEKPFMFITTQKVSNENWYNLLKSLSINFNVIFSFRRRNYKNSTKCSLSPDKQLSNILSVNDKFTVYITCPNRRYNNHLQ